MRARCWEKISSYITIFVTELNYCRLMINDGWCTLHQRIEI